MHMLRQKDLNSSNLETVRVTTDPVSADAANGEVHTKEEATAHVKELELFVTVKLLEDTPATHKTTCRLSQVFQQAPPARPQVHLQHRFRSTLVNQQFV